MRGPLLQPIFQPIMRPIVRAVLGASRGGLYNGPSLALRFGENQYLMGAIGKKPVAYQPDGLINFTRSTKAWEWDWQGNYSEVAAGVMRIAHDPLTLSQSTTPQTLGTGSYTFDVAYQYPVGKAVRVSADAANWMVGRVSASSPDSVTIWVSAPPVGGGTYSAWTLIVRRGIRVEELRTNLLLNSVLAGGTAGIVGAGAVAPTNWVFGSSGGLIAYGTSPWGAASFLTTKTTTADRPFLQRTFTAIANTAYTLSARVVSVSGVNQIADLIELAGRPAGSSVTYAVNGVVVSGTDTPSLKAWDLISTTVQVGATGGAVFLRLGIGSARPTAPIGSVKLTMPQLEAASAPSSYIPTEDSQVIRAADVPLVNTLAPWFNAAEGTLVVKAISSTGAQGLVSNTPLALFDGPGINLIRLLYEPTSVYMDVVAAGVEVVGIGRPRTPVAGEPFTAAAAYKSAGYSMAINGLTPAGSAAAVPPPPVTRLLIAHHPYNSNRFNGLIESITYHPRVIDVQQASA